MSNNEIGLLQLKQLFKGKRAVLLGNGRETTEAGKGSQIDSYDLVVRLNHGFPRPGLEKHMGCRTDIWACAYRRRDLQIRQFRKHWHQAKCVVRFGKTAATLHQQIRNEIPWFWFQNHVENSLYARLFSELGAVPSTGMMAAFLILDLIQTQSSCDLIGFDHFERPNPKLNSRDPRNNKNFAHSPELEKAYLQRLLCLSE